MRWRMVLVVLLAAASTGVVASARAGTRLRAFQSCNGLVDYGRHYVARESRSPNSRPQGVTPQTPTGQNQGAASAPTVADQQKTDDFSTTNVQEAGVDEPDIVKTDGSTVFALAGGQLQAVAVRGGAPKLLDSLDLPDGGQALLLRGTHLLVIGAQANYPIAIERPVGGAQPGIVAPFQYRQQTKLTEVDIHDPSSLKVLQTLTLDGTYVDGRQVGGATRLVLSNTPRAIYETAQRSQPSGWRPYATLRSVRAKRSTTKPLIACNEIRRAPIFSGLDMISVVTIHLDHGLDPVDTDGLLTDAQTVYASPNALYVATPRWYDQANLPEQLPQGTTTAVHEFAFRSDGQTDYVASGSVPGVLLNQYSLSEDSGHLRVASTDTPPWTPEGSQQGQSQSFVTVLDQQGGTLSKVGQVGDLGRGQRIYAVRFIGDVGYVVTFRQVDPLYTVGLSDPQHPKVLGSLELLGYSAYLHPVGNGLLLGVGQDATDQGRLQGAQVSLFDVSDLAHPKLLAHQSLGSSSSSQVQYDPHAFLFWAPAKLAVLPVAVYGAVEPVQGGGSTQPQQQPQPFVGAVALRASGAGLSELGRISHDRASSQTPIDRSLVVGANLITVSQAGLQANDLATLADRGWAAFPQPPPQKYPPGPQPGGPVQPAASSPPSGGR